MINFSGLKVNYVNFSNNVLAKFSNSPLKPLNKDIFVKSKNISSESVDNVQGGYFTQQKISEIFDETYEEVMQDNPIISELNITKPKLKFDYGKMDAIACYAFLNNTVTVSQDMNKDLYSISILRGGKEIPQGVYNDKDLEDFEYEFEDNLSVQKLNNDEKEVVLKSFFAHELRHFTQIHLVASTQGCDKACSDFHKECYKDIKRFHQEKKQELKNYKYSLTYKPQKLLSPDTKFQFEHDGQNLHYWSAKEHFLRAILNPPDEDNLDTYYSSPLEIDAYKSQIDYINKKVQEYPNISNETLNALTAPISRYVNKGLKNMKGFGYPDLLQ
jgi:hypothetical protein